MKDEETHLNPNFKPHRMATNRLMNAQMMASSSSSSVVLDRTPSTSSSSSSSSISFHHHHSQRATNSNSYSNMSALTSRNKSEMDEELTAVSKMEDMLSTTVVNDVVVGNSTSSTTSTIIAAAITTTSSDYSSYGSELSSDVIKCLDDDDVDDLDNEDNDNELSCNMSRFKMHQEEVRFNGMIRSCQHWIETISCKKFAYENDFRRSLENGVILCELINVLKKDTIRRINRHSTPIAGIDNLNQFLRACQDQFQISQTNLFDIIDLEDLNKRRGGLSQGNESYLNQHLIDEEQQRRLKKVVHTIYWLSRRANELGIRVAYLFDLNSSHNSQKPNNASVESRKSGIELVEGSKSSTKPSGSTINETTTQIRRGLCIDTSSVQAATTSVVATATTTTTTATTAAISNKLHKSSLDETRLLYSSSSSSSSSSSYDQSSSSSCLDMSYIYKQQQQLSLNATKIKSIRPGLKKSDDSSQAFDSLTSSSAVDQSNVQFDKVNIQQLEQTSQNGELQLIETQINTSQISMTTHSPVTPSNSSLVSPQQQQTIIPTRFIDRRVSTGVTSSDPYKFNVNYSEAGQRFAKKAHLQIKTLEKSKEVEVVVDNDGHSISSSSSRRLSNTSTEAINNFDSSSNLLGDDWQNSVDDWKRRRREKQKMPLRTNQSGEDESMSRQTSRTRRIHRFEDSPYYIQPLPVDGAEDELFDPNDKEANTTEKQHSSSSSPSPTHSGGPSLEPNNQQLTIETNNGQSSSKSQPVESQVAQKQPSPRNNSPHVNKLSEEAATKEPPSKLVFVERQVDISRPANYSLRGFGFLLNTGVGSNDFINSELFLLVSSGDVFVERPFTYQNYAQIVVVEPDTLADRAGLKKGDLVLEINDEETRELNNEQLRRIMRNRLQTNDIKMKILSRVVSDVDYQVQAEKQLNINGNTSKVSAVQQPAKVAQSSLSSLSTSSTSSSLLKPSPTDYHNIVAPKPFKKSSFCSSSSSSINQCGSKSTLVIDEMNDSLIEKRKSQLNVMLNWSKQPQQQTQSTATTTDLVAKADENNSLSPSSLDHVDLTSSLFDSLNESKQMQPATQASKPSESNGNEASTEVAAAAEAAEKSNNKSNDQRATSTATADDTDRDEEDEDSQMSALSPPPPVPASEPPSLPSASTTSTIAPPAHLLAATTPVAPIEPSHSASEIKKALLDSMKCVENWKIEQELLMKRKYEEEQKRIDLSLRLDLNKVKEEEVQRREQERLKLEKEKLRLQELELKQRETELKKTLELATSVVGGTKTATSSPLKSSVSSSVNGDAVLLNGEANDSDHIDSSRTTKPVSNEFVRKEDLNALIEKIYTEQSDEPLFISHLEHQQQKPQERHPVGVKAASHMSKSNSSMSAATTKVVSMNNGHRSTSTSALVMTKTSPLVMADLNHDDDELEFADDGEMAINSNGGVTTLASKPPPPSHRSYAQPSLIDSSKHEIIKQVHDSMDHLRNELLQKGMSKYADDVEHMNKSLETSRKKQEEMDRLKREQESIRLEKERIEMEKEKLRAEAEQLRREREMMLAANAQKQRSSAQLPANWILDETTAMLDQKLRRSVPNLLNGGPDSSNGIRPAYIAPPSLSTNNSATSAMATSTTRLRFSSQSQQQQQQTNQQPAMQSSIRNLSSKPPQPYYSFTAAHHQHSSHHHNPNRMISSSQNDLKFSQAPPPSSHKSKPSLSNTYVSPRSNGNVAGPTTPTTPSSCQIPTISLNQKCAGCTQVLGQGSAMYIEKLGLAFHLKCFRCSVCHQPLGNGLEGTDVRVSSHNRLHCNSCFSNDLGIRLSAV